MLCIYTAGVETLLFSIIIYVYKGIIVDASMWLSMVDELWNSSSNQGDSYDDSCTLKMLCKMNRLALEAQGSAGMVVSLSRHITY